MSAINGLTTKGSKGVLQVQGKQGIEISVAWTSDNTLITDTTIQSVSIPLSNDLQQVVFVIKLNGICPIGNKESAMFTDTPFLLHAKFGNEDPTKAVIDLSNGFIRSNAGRTGYIDNKGNVYVRVQDKLVTSNKDCTQANLFVNDPNLLCRYLADIGTEKHVITAAKKTARKISTAVKSAARIKELETELSQRDTTLSTFKKYLKGDECSWGMEQSLKKVPENVRSTFSKIEKIYSFLSAECTLLNTDLHTVNGLYEEIYQKFTAWKKFGTAVKGAWEKGFGHRGKPMEKALTKIPDTSTPHTAQEDTPILNTIMDNALRRQGQV